MSGQVRRSLVLALAGLIGGLALVLALFGGESLRSLTGRPAAEPPAKSAPESGARSLADPGTLARRTDPPIDFRDDAPGPAGAGNPAAGAAETPRFDIVRVEPNGDTVVAGRGAPHAVIEMLVDGKPVATATADASGQFAIVPPALPAGPSEIRLRMTGRDGHAASSEQSVAVQVAPGRDRQPLVALTAPDAATVVLSQPGAPGPGARVADAAPSGGLASGGPGAGPATRIVSVDVQGNGRLFVTATGAPGATLRLYLNDTLIAPGRIGPDGRASFTIGRGVKPGQYQVRIDRIDPATGKVDTRAEVPLTVPEPAQVAARGAARADGQGGGKGDGRGGGTGDGKGDAKGRAQGTAQATGKAGPDRTGSAAPAAAAPALPETRTLAAEAGGEAASGAVYVPEISTAKITRGDNLWRISQRTYGRGERYTVIYDANQTQIRDPDLIYPGQIFVLPTDKRG
ncbi:LysM peptidoglycan-binding domain-containing protein [Methylobacterium sp. J-026]|uniref:LysM peptidoglycan-binding domain-containing protein n=1 Tax=Methylobacterium sp. J-026 TaxID=2836624 RepID=UPI001FBB8FB5|nr:LysM peptidoglycan-binding domain-containing protein [Methylobacterium sp. J-026]MCJ2132673.1 LysM peptidoglycan-binding domain-containing protein [Methylobacterium sp. J-026]